ncbi:MAG TPA: hypothetical protein QF753_03705 [Victivallales bacterium]|nr:hypothetical protein [Victivallales bacterium]
MDTNYIKNKARDSVALIVKLLTEIQNNNLGNTFYEYNGITNCFKVKIELSEHIEISNLDLEYDLYLGGVDYEQSKFDKVVEDLKEILFYDED